MNRKLLFLLAVVLVGGIVAYRVLSENFNWALFFSSLSNLKVRWVAASIALSMLTYLLRAARWRVLLAPLKEVPVARLFWATVAGFSAIYLLGRTAEFARPLWLTRREGVAFSSGVAIMLVERFLDSIMLIAVFAWALVVIEVAPESVGILVSLKETAWFVATTALAALAFSYILRSRVGAFATLFRRFPKVAMLVEDFAQGLGFLGNRKTFTTVILQSALLWMVIATQSWFMFFAMGLQFSFGAATLVLVAAAIGSIAQIPGIGGGFQVAWIFGMTTFFSVPTEQATATAIIAFVLSYLPTIIVGCLYMMLQGISMRQFSAPIRRAGSEAA